MKQVQANAETEPVSDKQECEIAGPQDSPASARPEKASAAARAAKRKNERRVGPTLTLRSIPGGG
jgi:hypothetical protein